MNITKTIKMIFTFLAGIAFLGVSIFLFISSRPDSSWIETTGTIIDVQTKINNNGDQDQSKAIVEYEVDEQKYTITDNFPSIGKPNIGDSRELSYDPGNPDNSKLKLAKNGYLMVFLFGAIGLILMGSGSFQLIRSNKTKGYNI